MKDKVAVDFDGIINKLLPPMGYLQKHKHHGDWIDQAHLGFLWERALRIYGGLRFFYDGKAIDRIPRDAFIISGRTMNVEKAKVDLVKMGFKRYKIFFRADPHFSELGWKVTYSFLLGIDKFYDDRRQIVLRLREVGIDAREWK
jgi:hypothetical protein